MACMGQRSCGALMKLSFSYCDLSAPIRVYTRAECGCLRFFVGSLAQTVRKEYLAVVVCRVCVSCDKLKLKGLSEQSHSDTYLSVSKEKPCVKKFVCAFVLYDILYSYSQLRAFLKAM